LATFLHVTMAALLTGPLDILVPNYAPANSVELFYYPGQGAYSIQMQYNTTPVFGKMVALTGTEVGCYWYYYNQKCYCAAVSIDLPSTLWTSSNSVGKFKNAICYNGTYAQGFAQWMTFSVWCFNSPTSTTPVGVLVGNGYVSVAYSQPTINLPSFPSFCSF